MVALGGGAVYYEGVRPVRRPHPVRQTLNLFHTKSLEVVWQKSTS